MGSGTGLKPPPDNSFDRRADFSAAHRARKSTPKGLEERPQSGYAARERELSPSLDINAELRKALGFDNNDPSKPLAGQTEKAARLRAADPLQGARPDAPPTDPALERLLNPGIEKGTAGHGLGHRLAAAAGQFVRAPRRPAQRAHRARKSARARASTRRRSAATSRAATASCRRAARHQRRARQGAGLSTAIRAKPLIGENQTEEQSAPARDEISDISEPRREKRQMHRPSPQPVTLGVTASMEALEKLLREGRAGVRHGAHGVDAAPPAAAGEIRRRRADRASSPTSSRRATSRPRSRIWSRASSATTAPRCCSASPARARPSPWPR